MRLWFLKMQFLALDAVKVVKIKLSPLKTAHLTSVTGKKFHRKYFFGEFLKDLRF